MMPNIPDSVISTLIALGAGMLGYAFREYRNRVTPLFEIIKISTTSKRTEKVSVDPSIVNHLKGSFYPQEITPEATLAVVFDTWDRCDDLSKIWPETKRDIESAITATSDEEFKEKLATLLDQRFFERWLLKLLLNGRLDFLLTDKVYAAPEIVHTWIEDEDEHKVWFDLPPSGKSFGKAMQHPAVHAKCEPFITAISKLHRPGIVNAFQEFIRIFDQDYNKAMACVQDLRRIVDDNERWAVFCFLANTSSKPLVVESHGVLTIVDRKTKTRYQEPCYLTALDKDGDLIDIDTPLIIPNGEGKSFAFLTDRVQKEMELGRALRELYDRSDGNAHLSVKLRRSGLFRRQNYNSATAPFTKKKQEK